MNSKTKPASINRKIVISVLFIMVIDGYALYRLYIQRITTDYFFVIGGTLLLNVILFNLIGKFRDQIEKPKRDISDLEGLLDGMRFAEPMDIETFDNGKAFNDTNKEASEIVIEIESGEKPLVIHLPKTIVHQNERFDKPIKPVKYVEALFTHMMDQGLSIDKNNLREMFGSMAMTKLIVMQSEHPAITSRFIDVFTNFVGIKTTSDNLIVGTKLFDDLFKPEYSLIKAIQNASANPNRMYMYVLKDVFLNEIERYYDPVIDFCINPLLPCEISNKFLDVSIQMPNNLWFVVIPNKDSVLTMSSKLIQGSVYLDLSIKLTDPKDEVIENDLKYSYENFTNILFDGYDQYYIDESEWKKIDQIENYLKKNLDFNIDNRLVRQIERFTSTVLLFGGEKNQAIDGMFYTKLLRLISTLDLIKDKQSEESLISLFEKLFGLENLSRSKQLLKDIKEVESTEPEI